MYMSMQLAAHAADFLTVTDQYGLMPKQLRSLNFKQPLCMGVLDIKQLCSMTLYVSVLDILSEMWNYCIHKQ